MGKIFRISSVKCGAAWRGLAPGQDL